MSLKQVCLLSPFHINCTAPTSPFTLYPRGSVTVLCVSVNCSHMASLRSLAVDVSHDPAVGDRPTGYWQMSVTFHWNPLIRTERESPRRLQDVSLIFLAKYALNVEDDATDNRLLTAIQHGIVLGQHEGRLFFFQINNACLYFTDWSRKNVHVNVSDHSSTWSPL